MTCTWLQNRSQVSVAYWAGMYGLAALWLVLLFLRGVAPDLVSVGAANALAILAAGMIWAGARAFEHQKTPFWWYAQFALLWLVTSQLPLFMDSIHLRIAFVSIPLAGFLFLSAYALWRGRQEALVSRWPAIVLLTFYGMVMLLRIPVAWSLELPDSPLLFNAPIFGVVALASLLMVNALGFMLLALTKERTELLHKRAAHIDPLTELLNRRAFLESGEACFERQGRRHETLAALVFDLDRFKQVNDRFGHAVGDHVLTLFSAAVRKELRGTDIVGRMGGEEFVALLPDCTEVQALEAAERVRRTFAAAAAAATSENFKATVSIGVAMWDGRLSLAQLIASADEAAYQAKNDGRNCIRLAPAAATAPSLVPETPDGRAAA